VGKISAANDQVNAVVPRPIVEIIDERAKSLSISRSRFAALVFEWWEAQGCPPVTPADEALQILRRGKSGSKR
jgi:hypothetical protein